jgi:hypothetical protein
MQNKQMHKSATPDSPGFLSEKDIIPRRVPVSRRTWNTWKKEGIIPFIRIGRRCLYDWPSVAEALRRRQQGGVAE